MTPFITSEKLMYMENQKRAENANLVAFLYDYDNWQ